MLLCATLGFPRRPARLWESAGAPSSTVFWPSWEAALHSIERKTHRQRYIVVDAQNGLGNRLRALASAMALAAALRRPRRVMLVWAADLHVNCSFLDLLDAPTLDGNFPRTYGFKYTLEVLAQPIPMRNLRPELWKVYNYMPGEVGGIKDMDIRVDERRHLYFRSAFLMNNWLAGWDHAQLQLQRLLAPANVRRRPPSAAETDAALRGSGPYIGVHVRQVQCSYDCPDAPRTERAAVEADGVAAVRAANASHGGESTRLLQRWRAASGWQNFVPRMRELLEAAGGGAAPAFYVAADAQSAYVGLTESLPRPARVLYTPRPCTGGADRCDWRDCDGMVYALEDLVRLSGAARLLGSTYSSYTEVAAYLGGTSGEPLPLELTGRDFAKPQKEEESVVSSV